jgi:hypothetical protein
MFCQSIRSEKLNKEIAGKIVECDHPMDLNCIENPTKPDLGGKLEKIICWNHRGWEFRE